MRRLHKTTSSSAVTLASAAATLPFPPHASTATVPDGWSASTVAPQLDLKITAAAACNLTLAELYGGELLAGTIAADNVDTVDFANNELDVATHGLSTGDGPIQMTTATTLPAGLALLTDYWIIAVTTGTIQLASSLANALAGTAVAFTDAGTGTHTLTGNSPNLMIWHSMGLLGHAQNGSVTLTARQAYAVRVDHRPDVVAYAISATLSASTVSATITPVLEA